ncbi:MAG TPA: CHAD domain-containing protein [Propionibacteriaceae bacterium]|jgi:CHAD domain-containing protein|nr:CHAD domain-containing protein [Propionibacteriaceae bacterium]
MNNKPGTARDVIGGYLSEQCTVIIDSENQLRAGENVIHPTRVAVRRLRSTLRVFSELFDPSEAAHLEEELVWWASLLGDVRDMDILAQRQAALLDELPPELILGPVASTIQAELAVKRKQAMDAMLEALNSERYRKLVGLVHHWRSDPPFTAAADASPDSIDAAIKKARKKLSKRLSKAVAARRAGEPSDELFHRARKASKRHRYSVEAALPVWGSKADKIISQRKDLQDVLGNHQDSIVSAAFLRELGGRVGIRSGQNGFSYGVLYAREIYAGDSLLDDLKPFL